MRAPPLDAMEILRMAKLLGCKTSPECFQETRVSQFTKETRREDRQTQTRRPGAPTGGLCRGAEALTGRSSMPPFPQSLVSGPTEQKGLGRQTLARDRVMLMSSTRKDGDVCWPQRPQEGGRQWMGDSRERESVQLSDPP